MLSGRSSYIFALLIFLAAACSEKKVSKQDSVSEDQAQPGKPAAPAVAQNAPKASQTQAQLVQKPAVAPVQRAKTSAAGRRDQSSEAGKNALQKDEPDAAHEHYVNMTRDPALGYVPKNRLTKGLQYARKLLAEKDAIAGVNWTERGPNNVGGRTRALMIDPNDITGRKLWAGSVTGGLWYNNDITNANSSWKAVDDFMANLSINCLIADPANPQIFYMGTGDGDGTDVMGNGIWKSTDAGATWTALASTQNGNFNYVTDFLILNNKLFANTFSGLWVSSNGGNTWSQVFPGAGNDLELATDGKIYATFGKRFTTGSIMRSADGGDTWTDITPTGTSGERIELTICRQFPDVMYSVASTDRDVAWVKKSIDGGNSWQDLPVPRYIQGCAESPSDFSRSQAHYDLTIEVHPSDPDFVLLGGIDLYRSFDGGETFEVISSWYGGCGYQEVHADQHNMIYHPANENEIIFGNDGGVFYCSDAYETVISARNKDYNVTQFYSCAAQNVAGSALCLAGAQDNGTNRFDNPGINSTVEVTGGDGAFCFFDENEPNIAISSYVYDNYYVSTDGANDFNFVYGNSLNRIGRFVNPCDYDDDMNILYFGNEADLVGVLEDVGGSNMGSTFFADLGGTEATAIKVSPYTPELIFVSGENGVLVKISDAWSGPMDMRIDNNQLPMGYISSIDIGANDNQILVTYSNYGVTSVWETTNGGMTWVNKEGNLPDMPIRWALYNPEDPKQVLLATELGVWSTADISQPAVVWGPTNSQLANVRCDMLRYKPVDKTVLVATYGRGLFSTSFFSPPAADFILNRKLAYINTPIQFTDLSSGVVTAWSWDFGDGTYSTAKHPLKSYTAAGKYNVKLSVTVGGTNFEVVKNQVVHILPDRSGSYGLANGGNFEVNPDDFGADYTGTTQFQRGNSTFNGKRGTTSGNFAWVTDPLSPVYSSNSRAWLYTPCFILGTQAYTLQFKTAYSTEDDFDGMIVEYSVDRGSNWYKLGDLDPDWYNGVAPVSVVFPEGGPFFTGNTGNQYINKKWDLTPLAGQQVAFRFVFKSDNYSEMPGVAIDDFELLSNGPTLVPGFMADRLTACTNEQFTFTDTTQGPATTFEWNFGDGAVPPTATGPGPHQVSYVTPGTKNISLTVNGIVVSKAAYIKVDGGPSEAVIRPEIKNLCYNEQTNIILDNSETGVLYQLRNSNGNVNVGPPQVGNGSTLLFPTGIVSQTSVYNMFASSAGGCVLVMKDTAVIGAPQKPDTVIKPSAVAPFCEGETANIWVFEAEKIEWFHNGTPLSETNDTLAVSEGGDYRAILTIRDCPISTNTINITALPLPAAPTITATGGTLSSSPAVGYQWYLNGVPIAGATSQDHIPAENGTYHVEITDNNGCRNSSAAYEVNFVGLAETLFGSVKIYPNPAEDHFILEASGPMRYELFDPAGKLLHSGTSKGRQKLSMENLPSGAYLLRLWSGNNSKNFNIIKK